MTNLNDLSIADLDAAVKFMHQENNACYHSNKPYKYNSGLINLFVGEIKSRINAYKTLVKKKGK